MCTGVNSVIDLFHDDSLLIYSFLLYGGECFTAN